MGSQFINPKLTYLFFCSEAGIIREDEELPGYADAIEYLEEFIEATFDESVYHEVCDTKDPLVDFKHNPPWPYNDDPSKYSGVAYFNKHDQTTGFININEIRT